MSRFASLSPWAARLLLIALVAISLFGIIATAGQNGAVTTSGDPLKGDAALYRAVTKRVATAESYYHAVAAEHRARGYPLKPFVTVRPPLLAQASALVGSKWTERLFQLLVLATSIVLALSLQNAIARPAVRIAAVVLSFITLNTISQPDLAVWHEAWAATLIALALALRRPDGWMLSLAIGLAAAMLRELALPFLAVMTLCAATERRWREAGAWGVSIGAVVIALAIHAHYVAGIVCPEDLSSPGWSSGGGWPFVVTMLAQSSVLVVLPFAFVSLAVPLALIGWIGLKTPMGLRAALWSSGMVAGFLFFGRPDNFYWGMMLATTLPVGLAFAPQALTDLARASRGAQPPARHADNMDGAFS